MLFTCKYLLNWMIDMKLFWILIELCSWESCVSVVYKELGKGRDCWRLLLYIWWDHKHWLLLIYLKFIIFLFNDTYFLSSNFKAFLVKKRVSCDYTLRIDYSLNIFNASNINAECDTSSHCTMLLKNSSG